MCCPEGTARPDCLEAGAIDRANSDLRLFRKVHVRVVETGGIYPRVYVLERRDR